MSLKVFGHRNPDTDAIGAAIAYSYLLNQTGVDAEAVALGEPNEETQYALNHFGLQAPRVVKTLANETSEVALVDHNEKAQTISDIDELTVKYVVDHHRIANFQTSEPLYYRAEPLGCTSTILYKLYKEAAITIPKDIAGIMLSAIISDTLLFKSPTCTAEDIEIGDQLAEIAEVSLNEYGLALLKAGTNLASKSAEELIDLDAKTFELGKYKVRVAQVNTVDIPEVKARKDEFIKAINASGFDLFLLMITDILNSNTELLVVGEPIEPVEKAFHKKVVDQFIDLPTVVSRKKQIVPQLTDAF